MSRVLLSIVLGAILIIPATVQAEHPLEFYTPKFELTQRLTEGYDASSEVTVETEKKLPGRALLMSAIVPGLGQIYAGSKLRGAVFLALEAAGWATFAYYQTEGKDKEDEYEDFADDHWIRGNYWTAVQEIAELNDWPGGPVENAPWSELINYLPQNFTHELPSSNTQQYYEMIGKYLSQFGYGWDDAEEAPDDTTNYFDGTFDHNHPGFYNDLRYDSNKLLDRATIAIEIVLVNHVISALDAGFLVRRKNKQAVETTLNVEQKMFNHEPITMTGVKIRW
jgi:hypothetical protein